MNESTIVTIHHCTSQPLVFVGRERELALLDAALERDGPSVVAFIGPGGQGKTAIVQHWLGRISASPRADVAGVFFWSFYRGKESDRCLRALFAAVAGREAGDASATWCVDRLLPLLRGRRWIIVLDGAEVAQHEVGPWFGRFLHPDLGRLLEELASEPLPGVVLLTSRFPLPDLQRRPFMRTVSLAALDDASARGLLVSLGVRGGEAELDAAAAVAGRHAKAVELLATWLVHFHRGDARCVDALTADPATEFIEPDAAPSGSAELSDEERHVLHVLAAWRSTLAQESQDVLALATAFREPLAEPRLLSYLLSAPVRTLLHETWRRAYQPFHERAPSWLNERVDELVRMRLLERVSLAPAGHHAAADAQLIDAHPLVRRGFEHVLGAAGRCQSAGARAGFLRGRPDRARAATLDDAREEVELFHAYCDAGLWEEADRALAGLDQPRYRFLTPAFERDLLLRFYPEGDRSQPPRWPRFGRRRSLAVCLEMMGQFDAALETYPPEDAPLRGDALIASGQLGPLLVEGRAPHPWEMLWQAYRAHALCLAGRTDEARALCRRLVPRDVYEWTHVFECLLRLGELTLLDMGSFLNGPCRSEGSAWDELARRRMRADRRRIADPSADLEGEFQQLIDGYDRGGLPWERSITRLSYARWLVARGDRHRAAEMNATTLELARRHGMGIVSLDAWQLEADMGRDGAGQVERLRREIGCHGPKRP